MTIKKRHEPINRFTAPLLFMKKDYHSEKKKSIVISKKKQKVAIIHIYKDKMLMVSLTKKVQCANIF